MTHVAKTVKVLARIEYKRNRSAVVYICQSSNGHDQYRTTIYNGKATGCDCPATKPCYHMVQCEAREQSRHYDVVGAALAVVNQARADAQVADFYEQRAKDIERSRYLAVALQQGWE